MTNSLKYNCLSIILLISTADAFSQIIFSYQHVDSLKEALYHAKTDTARVLTMAHLSEGFRWSNSDSAMKYGINSLALAKKTGYKKGEASALVSLSVVHRELGNLPEAMNFAMQGLKVSQEYKLPEQEAYALLRIANVYVASKNLRKALGYMHQMEIKAMETNATNNITIARWLQAEIYCQLDLFDSARYYISLAKKYTQVSAGMAYTYNIQGDLDLRMKNESGALANYKAGLATAFATRDLRTAANLNNSIASFYKKKGNADSAIHYAKEGLAVAEALSYKNRIMLASSILAEIYESRDAAVALKYYKIYAAARDSLFSPQKMQAVQGLLLDEQERKNETENTRKALANKRRRYLMIAGLAIFSIIIFILFRNNKQKQKANILLSKQKAEIDQQKQLLEKSITELRSAQAQLIQSEKMASLGELTAGIAHEIQNPLNFVNNFSELNIELLTEMNEEIEKGNIQEMRSLANDIASNEEKIKHHGKRADAIVKGMLQHSRSSSGAKEPTDINALADEYLRMAYHGLRAKDKSFNATLKTDYDEKIGNINIIPQDIGRVILNLITNAFYAVNEKTLSLLPIATGNLTTGNYEPTVSISTNRVGDKIQVKVKDNGNGIPEKVLDKIFQPFFTTKPTGQGTGLGLSLSYDIVKAHGGDLNVSTLEARQNDPVGRGGGTEFIIWLPVDNNL